MNAFIRPLTNCILISYTTFFKTDLRYVIGPGNDSTPYLLCDWSVSFSIALAAGSRTSRLGEPSAA